ncbi:MAG: glycosyltransferase family 2 protein [Ignavibacteriota bacterium]
MKIAVIVPCYNEERTVAKVVADFRRELPDAAIYVGDNNSTDSTALLADQAGATVIPVYRQGKGAVARALFREVEADLYVMVDGDDTYPAAAVHKLIEPVRAGRADMAVGDRRTAGGYRAQNQRRFHGFGNALVTSSINLLFRCRLRDIMSGYRVCSRRFVRNLTIPSDGFELETGMTLHALEKRFTVAEIPIEYRERPPESFSKLRTFGDGFRVLREILWVYKDAKPLVFFTVMSAMVLGIALAIGVPVVIEFMRTGLVLKFPRAILACGLAVISSLLLICGFILDTIVKLHHENYELHLNRQDRDQS